MRPSACALHNHMHVGGHANAPCRNRVYIAMNEYESVLAFSHYSSPSRSREYSPLRTKVSWEVITSEMTL
jgi:hypothetical protein